MQRQPDRPSLPAIIERTVNDMKKDTWLGGIAASLGLAFLTFLLLFVVVNAGGKELLRFQQGSDDTVISNWEFVWSGDRQSLESSIDQWQLASSQHPVAKALKDMLLLPYVRLHVSLPAHDTVKSLELTTQGNPIKVWLNGAEVYNNRYDTDMFTGNRVNIVSLPASTTASEVDVFMRAPFSFSLNARFTDPAHAVTVESMPNQIGLIGSSALMITGVLVLLMTFLFSLKNKGMGTAVCLSFLIIAAGAGSFLNQFTLHSTFFTSPWIYKIQLILLFLVAAGVVYLSVRIVDGWHLPEIITTVLMLVYTLAFALLNNSIGIWLIAGFPILLLFAAIMIMMRLADAFQAHTRYAPLVTYAFLTAFFCQIYDAVSLVTGWNVQGAELRNAGLFLFGIVLFAVLVRQSLYTNIRLVEREQQIEKDTQWIQKTVSCCAHVLAQQGLPNFCIETAKSIKELILFDRKNTPDASPDSLPIRIGMALIQSGGFMEIYTENKTEPCQYDTILARAKEHPDKSVFFGDHNLDIVMSSGEKPLCILHMEGIANGLSPSLQSIILSAYTSISAALNSLETKMDMVNMQESVFINLAEIVEQKSSGMGEHLQSVAAMVAVMCDELGIPDHEKHVVAMASMVHDIGKLAIPESILGKQGRLTSEEFSIMQDHVIYGYNIMSKSPGEFMEAAAIIAQQHHEKYDGTGYLELRGEEIHLYARIVAIADVFDALLSERPYKKAWSAEKASTYINEQSGKHFDPKMVEVFNRSRTRLIKIKLSHS